MINVHVRGMQRTKDGLAKRHRKLSGGRSGSVSRKLYARAVIMVEKWIQKNFQQEGKLAYPGRGWQPLSPVTIARRRKGKGRHGDKILQDTGKLRNEWKKQWSSRHALIQAGMPYADKHHYGKGVPERRILPTEEQIMPELLKVSKKFVKAAIS